MDSREAESVGEVVRGGGGQREEVRDKFLGRGLSVESRVSNFSKKLQILNTHLGWN